MKGKILAALGVLIVLQGCRQADSVVLLNVEAGTDVAPVGALRVTMSTAQSHDTRVFPAQASPKPVVFPTSLVLVIPRSRSGRLDLVIEGLGATSNGTVASGTAQTIIVVGGRVQKSVTLAAGTMLCGNTVVDPGEQCDDGNLFSLDGCDFRCQLEGPQVDGGAIDGPTVETESWDGAADALVERTRVETDADNDVQGDSSADAVNPDLPYVVDTASDLLETGTGGNTSTGGTLGLGGNTGTGGMLGTGGNARTGGTVSMGGTTSTGGTTFTGGNVGSGGMANTGGVTNTGGIASTGGLTNTGGITNTGGVTNTGGIASTGGLTSTGGITNTGGSAGTAGSSGGEAGGTGGSAGTPAGTPGQSCSSLAATCGPYGNESCCASLLVPGGSFYRSYDGVDFTDKSFSATVSDFALDRYEVTVGRFRAFVTAGQGTKASPPAAGAGAHSLIAGSGWNSAWNANLLADTASLKSAVKCEPGNATWTDTPGVGENRPMNCLFWYEAFAFCAWDGGRLPTEAEWNYAASGGSEQRYYPWSNPPTSTTIDPTYAVYSASGTNARDVGSKSPKGDGKWGHADLGGNEWEIVLDWFNSPYSKNICINCADLAAGATKAVRGGGFLDLPRVADRGPADPMYRNYDVGFRCARASQ
jgi:sulfatase modifying factor 1